MSAPPSGADAAALQGARELHRRGDFTAAIESYARLLERDGSLAEVWHLKGMAEHQAGRMDAALESAARAIASGGAQPAFLLLEGNVLHDKRELAQAEERFVRVAQASPEWAAGHLALGQVRMDQMRLAEALQAFRAAVAAEPSHARAWNNVGIALLALDRRDEAAEAFGRALEIEPGYALAHFNLARIHNNRDTTLALKHAEAAVRADPRLADAWLLLGEIHRRNLDPAKAMASFNNAIQAAPRNPEGWNARAGFLAEAGNVEDARREFAAIAPRFPGNYRAALGANLLLPRVYDSAAHLDASRREYAEGLDRLHESAERFRFPNAEAALVESRWTNFYLAYQGRHDRPLQERYADLQQRVLRPAVPELLEPRAKRAPRARVRVGFFSHFFFNCVVGRYFSSWITHLDRSRFEIFVYYTNELMANDTRTIAAASDEFRHLAGTPLLSAARQVIADELDILVYPELGMHPDTLTFAALRLAPVQCAGWGHPTTTGSPQIDWFVSCEGMEPEGAQSHYSERLALLPGLGTRYAMPAGDAVGSRGDFGLPEDRTLYLVPQSLFKIHPDNDALIAEVLARDPRGTAVMFSSSQEKLTQAFTARLTRAFASRGLDFAQRVRFLKPSLQHAAYLRLNQLCDVMLDTLHWSGGNTALDAFASGLPLVTLPGALMRGRQSRAMLRMMQLDELIARDEADYVAKAAELGRDRDLRRSLSQRIEAHRGALFERDEPVRAFETFLERAASR